MREKFIIHACENIFLKYTARHIQFSKQNIFTGLYITVVSSQSSEEVVLKCVPDQWHLGQYDLFEILCLNDLFNMQNIVFYYINTFLEDDPYIKILGRWYFWPVLLENKSVCKVTSSFHFFPFHLFSSTLHYSYYEKNK